MFRWVVAHHSWSLPYSLTSHPLTPSPPHSLIPSLPHPLTGPTTVTTVDQIRFRASGKPTEGMDLMIEDPDEDGNGEVCLPVCCVFSLFICLSVCLLCLQSVHLSVCLLCLQSACLSAVSSVCSSVCLSAVSSVCSSVCLLCLQSVCLSAVFICLSVCCVHLSVCLSDPNPGSSCLHGLPQPPGDHQASTQ